MGGMKLPRFSLRTLFVLITLISLPLGWSAYQLNWIRQRQEFAQQHFSDRLWHPGWTRPLAEPPWPLKVFGDPGYTLFDFRLQQSDAKRTRELFPELFAEQ